MAHITSLELATLLRDFAERARRLPPSDRRRPELFYEAKDALAADIDALASSYGAPPAKNRFRRVVIRETFDANGRRFMVQEHRVAFGL